jgi:hypothetical protein
LEESESSGCCPDPLRISLPMAAKSEMTLADCRLKINARLGKVSSEPETFEKLVRDAHTLCQAELFSRAEEKLVDVVACLETNAKEHPPGDPVIHAQALHNLAATLHQQGHMQVAGTLYMQAYEELRTAPADSFECCLLPNAKQEQLAYMLAKAALISEGKKPNPRAYLNGYGEEAFWTDEEVEQANEYSKSIEVPKVPTLKIDTTALEGKSYPSAPPPSPLVPRPPANLAPPTYHLSESSLTPVGSAVAVTSTPRKELW